MALTGSVPPASAVTPSSQTVLKTNGTAFEQTDRACATIISNNPRLHTEVIFLKLYRIAESSYSCGEIENLIQPTPETFRVRSSLIYNRRAEECIRRVGALRIYIFSQGTEVSVQFMLYC